MYNDLDLFADVDQLAGVVDALGPAHLGDVDQSLDALFELDEGAVTHDVDNLANDPSLDRIFVGDVFPRAGALLLQTQSDLLAILVDVQDHDLDLVVDLEHVAGMIDSAPTHIGDVKEAVNDSQVHERGELSEIVTRSDAASYE